ncbi:MAG: tetratricopeptide repeat protein [Betaproteobacteria bacterium]|nr:tetratricopeptide repeat protein [Betaproteobacteria bacterium]
MGVYDWIKARVGRRPSVIGGPDNRLMGDTTVDSLKGHAPEVRAEIESALSRDPANANLNCQLGELLLDSGDAEQALDLFNLALHYQFDCYPACRGKVLALERLGRGSEAIAVIEAFLDTCPEHADAGLHAAEFYYRAGNHEAAVGVLEPLLQRDPANRDAANVLGLILGREYGEFGRAGELLRSALAADPDWLPALVNLGWTLLEQGRYQEGYACIDRALMLAPHDAEARLVRACMKLKQGEFSDGWRDYSSRHQSRFATPSAHCFPQWRGEPLDEKTLLIHAEQGIGDQIMFASCFAQVIALAKRTIIECNPKLVSLFRRSFPEASIYESPREGTNSSLPESTGKIDYQIAMGELPGMFRNHWEDFPPHKGYLLADPEKVLHWLGRLKELGEGFNLGVSWRGGMSATRKHLRSIELGQMVALLRPPLRAVSLQYGPVDSALEQLRAQHGKALLHWQDAIEDYDQTAALVCALDGVLSVCTAVVHLSGALGRPVWVLAPVVTEWRYLDKGERMPWYPSVRIIRQEKIGDWSGAIGSAVEMVVGKMADKS